LRKGMELPAVLRQKLQEREQKGILRQLKTQAGAVDFCSNDYLGLARSPVLKQAIEQELLHYTDLPI
jgi:8-amino-7-oxononanoate synthase